MTNSDTKPCNHTETIAAGGGWCVCGTLVKNVEKYPTDLQGCEPAAPVSPPWEVNDKKGWVYDVDAEIERVRREVAPNEPMTIGELAPVSPEPHGPVSERFMRHHYGPSGKVPEPTNPVSHLLGKYLNEMVSDLGIEGKGQYLRDLFSRYEAELRESCRAAQSAKDKE